MASVMNKLDTYIYSAEGVDPSVADSVAIKEFMKVAEEYRSASNGGNRLRIHLILRNRAVANALRRIPLESGIAENVELYAFTREDLWSMEVLGIMPGTAVLLDRKPITAESNSRVHLVLFGATAQAESLALHTALVAHYPNYCRDNTLRTRITWVSDSMDDFNHFKWQYKGLLENSYRRDVRIAGENIHVNASAPKYLSVRRDFVDIEWEFVAGECCNSAVLYKLCKWAADEEQQLAVAFCYGNEEQNLNGALSLPLRDFKDTPFLLRVDDAAAVELLRHTAEYSSLIPFGMSGVKLEKMHGFIGIAQHVNYAYSRMRTTSAEEKEHGATDIAVATELPAKEELQNLWNSSALTTAKRWSNLYNAFTLNSKMRSAGHPAEEWKTLFAMNGSDIETMAEVEHNRWCVEELILGYTPTTPEEHDAILGDIEKRRELKALFKHDDLRTYSELGVDETGLPVKRYDVGIIRSLPLMAHSFHNLKEPENEK